MPYSTYEDLVATIGEDELTRLTGGTEPDLDKINNAIKNADCLIDAYTFGKCRIDDENIPDLIRKISVDLTLVILSENYYHFSELSNTMIRKRRDSISLLQELSKGKITPVEEGCGSTIKVITNKLTLKGYENEY
jgi:phage gp36-like protein